MKKLLLVSSVLALSACSTVQKTDIVSEVNQELNNYPSAAGLSGAEDWARGYILVQPRAGLSNEKFDEIVRGKGGRSLGRLANLPIHKIEVPENAEDAVVRALAKNPSIKFAEKDMLMPADELIPDDPRFSGLWHLSKVKAPLAWELSQGDGVVIAVLDSGVYGGHPDLSSKMVGGWNVVSANSDTADINGHGTAVAGFVGAATNNGVGIASVGFNAQIMPIRITNNTSGSAYFSNMAKGLVWATDNGAKVANISYRAFKSSTVTTAANYMRNKGGVVVVSAGNQNTDLGYSNNASMITVAATTSSDSRASFSNYGDYIDVTAPGASVITTNRGGGYSTWNGTSFSSPLTAGVVGLIMSVNQNLSPDQVESILESTADDLIDGVDWHMYYGHGRVNAANAVQLALNTSAADNQPPQVTIFSPSLNAEVKGNVSVEINAVDNVGIKNVALYVNDVMIASETTVPFQFSWDTTNEIDGEVNLTAKATDAMGNEGVSSDYKVNVRNAVQLDDYSAPTVMIGSPINGAVVTRTVAIYIEAADDVEVAEIQLFIDGVQVSSVSGGVMSYSWNTRKELSGAHNISALAIDTSGKSSEVASVEVLIEEKELKGRGKK